MNQRGDFLNGCFALVFTVTFLYLHAEIVNGFLFVASIFFPPYSIIELLANLIVWAVTIIMAYVMIREFRT